ncbi:MAG TPA: phosphatase PAP2 family protein, partial [Thermoanaerobaculia bacterium]|nr:phosphatase PAP2 family protein [Thermoanaerobaculia bacterium]
SDSDAATRSVRLVLTPAAVFLLLVSCTTARRAGELAAADVAALVTAPARAEPRQWQRAALAAGAAGAAFALDDEARALVLRNDGRALDNIARAVEPFGGRYSERTALALLAAGAIRDDPRMTSAGADGLMTWLIASKGITPLLKSTFHRDRPGNGGNDAFPSNHATAAFGMATVIASHYERRWIGLTAYAIASGVAWSRMYGDDHWFSDVVAGAAIGTATGRLVVATHGRVRSRWRLKPLVTRDGAGVALYLDSSIIRTKSSNR